MTESIQRRLAAILAADVVGYSRLMGEDEAGALAALRALRKELFEPAVGTHHGVVVKSMGDGWLVEFASVVDAVTCAVQIQEGLAGHDIIKLRIGVHLGDISREDEDLYGNGVNIAARLQEIAQPGAIVISDMARRSIDGRLAGKFADAGERQLKNIAEPLRLYSWGADPEAASPGHASKDARPGGLVFAILPFRTVSDGDDGEILSEGILTDLTDSVSRLKWLRVIAAGTMRQFGTESRDIAAIARELDADYLLEGDLRKAGDRVRAAVRVIDAHSSRQVSADRFEGSYADLFDLQDDIVARVVRVIEPNLMEAEFAALRERPLKNVGLWPLIVELRRAAYSYRREELDRVEELADQILHLDPDSAYVCGLTAFSLLMKIGNGWHSDPQEGWRQARRYLQRGFAADPGDDLCLTTNATVNLLTGDAENALRVLGDIVSRDPNAVYARISLAFAYAWNNRLAEAVRETDVAQRLSPRDPLLYLCYHSRGLAEYRAGHHEEAIAYCSRALTLQPGFMPARRMHIAALVANDRDAEARDALTEYLAISPTHTAENLRGYGITLESVLEALVSVGLPE